MLRPSLERSPPASSTRDPLLSVKLPLRLLSGFWLKVKHFETEHRAQESLRILGLHVKVRKFKFTQIFYILLNAHLIL